MMSDEMIRLKLHAAADDCFSGVARMPSQKKAVMDRIEKMENRRIAHGRPRMTLVLAAVMVLALVSVGAAAGLGLFGLLRGGLEQEMNYTRLGLLEDAAVTVGQTTALGDLGELTIDQTYCDGNRLYYSYTMRRNDALTSLFIGDGAKLTDGAELPPVDSWIEAIDDFATAAFYEVALPEGFTTGESVTILLTALHMPADGAIERIDVPVEIPVTPARALTGEGTADGYKAEAALFVSDVDVYGTVRITAPEDYSPKGYDLIADGKAYENIGWGIEYDGEAHSIILRYDLPGSLAGAKLAPRDPDFAHESIALEMTEGDAK